jgi:hypothetical protein
MATVTIEGNGSWVGLGRGQRKTVALTDRIERLITRGFVVEIARHGDDAPAAEEMPNTSETAPRAGGGDPDSEEEAGDPEHPVYTASRAVWAKFLDTLTPPVEYDADDDRDDLINRWQQSIQVQQ